MKEKIFFGENGLTTTSANHVANLAKEFVAGIKNELEEISFVSSDISVIGCSEKTIISHSTAKYDFDSIEDKLKQIISANSLIAWLREGIKAKQKLVKELNNIELVDWCDANGLEYPNHPVKSPILTEDEYMESLSVKERNLIYHLQTKAAVIGGFIHPDGAFACAREQFIEKKNRPHDVSGTGRDTIVYSFESDYDIEEINAKFFELQKEYREAQAELNGLLHKRTSAIEMDAIQKNNAYKFEMEEYTKNISLIQSKFEAYIIEENKKINDLKIVIPNDLASIYQKVNSLGVASPKSTPSAKNTFDIDALAALKRKLAGED